MAAVLEAAESICTVFDSGTVEWYNAGGEQHHIDSPAVEGEKDVKRCIRNGEYHRVDGAAFEEKNGFKWWFMNGKGHRLDGPACEHADGNKWWFVNDRQASESDFPAAVAAYCESHPNCPSVAYYLSVSGRFKKPARSA